MTAVVLIFPIELCSKPSTEVARAERAAYDGAFQDWKARPNTDAPLLAMMGLALEGVDNATRQAARDWMLQKCGVTVAS